MKYQLFCISIVFLYIFHLSSSFTIKGIEIDRLALNEFKAKIRDPRGVMNSWIDTTHVCFWYGVTCAHKHQRVRVLDLRSSQLVGSITPFIGNMSFLMNLELQNNSLNGVLPPEIEHLRRLRNLNLANNSIGGVIPSNISRCSKLISLELQRNRFVGRIHTEFGLLSNLQFLLLRDNNLMGKIPPSLGNLTFISRLFLSENNLVGNIPDSFAKLQNLNTLDVFQNQLSGFFPLSILNLSFISILQIRRNQFYGNLPSYLDIALPNLKFFNVAENLFSGSIPASIANLTSLREVYLLSNKFIGKMPSLKKLERLTIFSITDNFLGSESGGDLSFISSMINGTNLQVLMINFNKFEGPLPKTIVNLSRTLALFYIDNNKISGRIPTGIENLIGLEDLHLWNNKLSGYLPKSIGKLRNLQRLVINGNMLSGQIPQSIGQCQQLTELYLQENNLSGEIPAQVFKLSSLSFAFVVSVNHLSGSLPTEIGNLRNLGILDIAENKLSGEIPYSLGSCINLEALYMEGNLFHKSIPPSLSSLRGLQFLDLSRNNLSGEIPGYFASFQLQVLNLSYNNFQGKLPTRGIFENSSVIFVVGNNKLCGGIQELKLPICEIKVPKETHPWKLVIAIICGFVGLVLLSLLAYIFWYKKKKKELPSSTQTFSINSFMDLSYHSLFNATNGFSSENLIGIGSFGSVYKGTLDERQIVAIKVLNLQCRGASKSFTTECEALRNTRHRNLIKVLTTCSSIDNHGNDFKALVYEFMTNGSLEDWLHPRVEINEGFSPRQLNFSQRLNIVIDVAFALDYLHQHCGVIMVHCDIKPSNVLLDDEMVGHVSDFGLAKFLSLSTTITTQSSSFGFRGTIGYTPPEYSMTNEVSTSGDVYSFGILLLEMFTGKRPTNDVFKEGFNLHRYCKEAIFDNMIRILDPSLNQEVLEIESKAIRLQGRSRRSNKKVIDGLTSLFELGISCSAELPKNHPNITDVVARLCVIRNIMI